MGNSSWEIVDNDMCISCDSYVYCINRITLLINISDPAQYKKEQFIMSLLKVQLNTTSSFLQVLYVDATVAVLVFGYVLAVRVFVARSICTLSGIHMLLIC